MSETDSFIDEVTEEVRRDKLFATFKKYGWIGGLVILGIVGGTGWNEWSKAREVARSQALGDALLDAVDIGDPADRLAAIKAAPASGAQTALVDLLLSSDPTADRAASLDALKALMADTTQPQTYRDMATLRLVMQSGADMPLAERRAALETVAVPGRPMRVLALEQLGYLLIEDGQTDAAITALIGLMADQEATESLKARLRQVIVALGGTPPEAAAG